MNLHSVKCWLLYLAVILSTFVPLTVTALTDPLDAWHARYSSPANRLWGVAYGNNTFVAVGDSGTVLTSPNGTTWTPNTSVVTGGNLLGVTFGNGKFIAVGTNGVIIASTTGQTWITKNSGFNNVMLSSVAYGNNTFVAVGEGGTILVSSDGEIWTVKTSGTNDSFTGVAFGNDVFVAVGYCNNIFTSSDGEIWRRTMMWGVCTGSPARELTGVAYGNNMFVAVGVVPGAAKYIGSVFISEDNKPYSPAGDSWGRRDVLQYFNWMGRRDVLQYFNWEIDMKPKPSPTRRCSERGDKTCHVADLCVI